jgi:hypothetical protein
VKQAGSLNQSNAYSSIKKSRGKNEDEEYNPFQITELEMRRIKQSVHLSDESLQKLWEREQMIREF